MSLQDQIDKMRSEIRTDDYSMSIGEWMSLYRDSELDIHPEFQRFFRWSMSQKTKLIESILLGIPIPPIFVSQREDGKWDVIDGLQRLGTIFEFAGILRSDNGDLLPPLVLEATKYLPHLENRVWDEEILKKVIPQVEQRSLFHIEGAPLPLTPFSSAQRLFVKRSKIGVSIILKESDEKSKYELFQRLNTGGTQLSNQEVRNCLLIMTNRDIYEWIANLSKDPNFQLCTPLTETAIQEQYNLELILRFLVLRRVQDISNLGTDVNEFLTEEMLLFAQSDQFNTYSEEEAFRKTFEILAKAMGENCFKRYVPDKDKFMGGFLIPAFETIAAGVGYNYEKLLSESSDLIINKIKELWTNQEIFSNYARGGIPATTRLRQLVPLGREVFGIWPK